MTKLRPVDEIFVLALDQSAGGFIPLPRQTLHYALAGAILMDLQLQSRIDTDLTSLILLDPTPVEDDLLDPALSAIASSDEQRDASYWVRSIADTGADLEQLVRERLIRQGVLTDSAKEVPTLDRRVAETRRYPRVGDEWHKEVRLRLMQLIFNDEIPSPEDIVIVSLASVCGVFEQILSNEEHKEARGRIAELTRMDLIAQATAKLERESHIESRLRPVEETLILLLDESTGEFIPTPVRKLHYALAGAILMDLQLEGRIDTDLADLVVVDPTPLGDDLLDPVLAAIANSEEQRDAVYWVKYVANDGSDLELRVKRRLVERGLLVDHGDGTLELDLRLVRTRRYRRADGSWYEEVHVRVMHLLFDDEIPDPADIVILALAKMCGVFERILTRTELGQTQERLDQLVQMDLIAQATARLIEQVIPIRLHDKSLHRALPRVKGLPIVGNALALAGGPRAFLTKNYLELGPAFLIKLLSKDVVVLAGPEANLFMQRNEQSHFHASDMWDTVLLELGANEFVLGMNGAEHFRMRRELRDGFSSKVFTERLTGAVEIIRNQAKQWGLHEPRPTYKSMQHIVAEQLGVLTASVSPAECRDELIRMVGTILRNSLLVKSPLPWRTRQYRRDRAKVMKFCNNVLAEHQLRHSSTPDLVDGGIALHRSSPSFLPEVDLPLWVLLPYAVGIDTAGSAAAFMLYCVLKQPGLQAKIRAEADEFFNNGGPTQAGLRKLDVTRRALMESMRMYPSIPIVLRKTVSSFEFHGYEIPAGVDVLVGIGVSNYLPELYPDPMRFDIDRFLPGRDEHKQPGAFAPFGVGAHTCLGNNLVSVQVPVIILTLLHMAELEMDPPGYELKIVEAPFVSPDERFKFRISKLRQAL